MLNPCYVTWSLTVPSCLCACSNCISALPARAVPRKVPGGPDVDHALRDLEPAHQVARVAQGHAQPGARWAPCCSARRVHVSLLSLATLACMQACIGAVMMPEHTLCVVSCNASLKAVCELWAVTSLPQHIIKAVCALGWRPWLAHWEDLAWQEVITVKTYISEPWTDLLHAQVATTPTPPAIAGARGGRGSHSSGGAAAEPDSAVAEVLENTLWNRQLGVMSEEIVAALVCQIFDGAPWLRTHADVPHIQ